MAARNLQSVQKMFDSSLCKMHYDLGTDQAPWSVARFSGVRFHGVDVYDDQGIGGRKVLRNRDDILANPADDYLLAMPRSARINLAQNGKVENCTPGRAILFSTAMPFSSAIVADRAGGPYAQLLARISGAMLRQRLPHIDLLSNHVFDTDAGAGKVVKTLFQLGISEGSLFSAQQSWHFGDMVIDAVANLMREAEIPGNALPSIDMSARARLRRQAFDFIECNLSNPDLDIANIASHCGVSERYLHGAFAEVSLKLAAYIRGCRLRCCRQALRDPALRAKSVSEIASQWGYDDLAHFSRAYKAMFGFCPSKDRSINESTATSAEVVTRPRRC